MHQSLLFLLLLCSLYTENPYFEFTEFHQYRNESIYYSSPQTLAEEVLLIPAFDTLSNNTDDTRERLNYVRRVNAAAKEANTTLREVIEKVYPYKYQLVSLADVSKLQQNGKKYYLDLVLMPKQMQQLKAEALIPSFERHHTANRMYRNNNLQFHYYFYIRDLQTGDIYASTKPKGNPEVYKGIDKFLRQVLRDL